MTEELPPMTKKEMTKLGFGTVATVSLCLLGLAEFAAWLQRVNTEKSETRER